MIIMEIHKKDLDQCSKDEPFQLFKIQQAFNQPHILVYNQNRTLIFETVSQDIYPAKSFVEARPIMFKGSIVGLHNITPTEETF